ncbi:MAG: 5'/3'-nucleotidase SurE [Lachnospiraceae bacterium]|nr:5'/3'-nucleotidase SurE [Lachnospiraceae bacterium]
MRKILITNDDGIDAEGIIRLAETAKEFGEVWVIAPAHQRSAASHCITLREPVEIKEVDFPVEGVKAFACSGTPADCVRVGSLSVMPYKPDVVLSGINYGYNVASDIQYSATCGAAFEASFQGFISIALSENASKCHDITDAYIKELLSEYIDFRPERNQILNINFPTGKVEECKGIKRDLITSEDSFYHDRYKMIEEREDGTKLYMVDGIYNEDAEEGTDFRAVVDKYISVGLVNNIR